MSDTPTTLADAQQALQRAQMDRGRVLLMRTKTRQVTQRAEEILAENHFADRIRKSWTS